MDEIYKAVIRTKTSYLVHYNHNHDKLGRFAKGNGVSSSQSVEKYKKDQETYKQERDEAWKDRKTNPDGFKEKMGKAQAKLGEAYKKLKESQDRKAKEYADYVSGIDHDEFVASLEKFRDEGKKYQDEELRELAKIAGDIAKDEKNFIPDKDISKFTKNHQLKSFKGEVGVDHGYDFRTGKEDYNVVGNSSTRTWKEEVKSKNGVHIIQSHPTTIDFGDVGSSGGGGLNRKKLKTLDTFARSKESNKAIYAGRDLVASTMKGTNKQDWSPMDISFGFVDDTPVIKNATYFNKKGGFDEDFITVEFDKNRKPHSPWHT